MMYGPGTNGGEIVSMFERQAEYMVRAIKRMHPRASPPSRSGRLRAGGTAGCNRKMKGTSWTLSHNYFKAPTGKVVTQWPIGCSAYRALTKVFGHVSETTRRRVIT